MKNKILILMGVGALTYASANLSLVNTQAALTAPTSYNYSYRASNVDTISGNNWAIRNNGGSAYSSLPTYTQTYDGQYYYYVHSGTEIVSGLTVSHTFNRSTTSWSNVSGSTYRPNNAATFIGSNNTVGSLSKFYFKFDNQTNKNYILYLDFSSTTGDVNVFVNHEYNDIEYDIYGITTLFNASSFSVWFIPAFTKVEFTQNFSSNLRYFDAWYLQDLGTAASWTNGYDDGYTQGETDGYDAGYSDGYDEGYDLGYNEGFGALPMQSMFTMAFAGIAGIFNIAVIGGLTIGNIIVAPIAIALLWFILGIVSGVGGKGKK
jgi:hypothetical protein